MSFPKITFGIIVLNGEPFTRYCLRSVYPFAHEIIVVEGGHEDTRSVSTDDGHSVDGTLETLLRFKKEEDPDNKVQIITKNGFWPKSDETGTHRTPQSQAYADKATGDYLWQIDIDEFYRAEDIRFIIRMLRDDPSITAVTFPSRNFWGDPSYIIDGWKLRRGSEYIHRLFKWGEGYKYLSHEPPTVIDEKGRDLRTVHWIKGSTLKRKGIFMYHYPQLFPWQVRQKTMVYKDEKPDNCSEILEWAEKNYFKITNPFNIERHYWMPSWLEQYKGEHPAEVIQMMGDVKSGIINAEVRENSDVEKILSKRKYFFKVKYMKLLNIWDLYAKRFLFHISRIKNVPGRIKHYIGVFDINP